jgi:anti-anti-sigma factor
VIRKEPLPGHGAALAASADSGQAAFATTTVGPLTARSACSEPGTLTIELEGELDIASAPALEQLLGEVEHDRWPTVVVDLRHLSFIDSSGIRVLLAANRRIGGLSGRMVVRDASRPVRRTLAAIGADSILDLTDVIDQPTRDIPGRRPPPDLRGSESSGDESLVSDLQPAAGPTLMEVTNAVVTACKAHTGKGPQRARAHLAPSALYVVLQDWMTTAEHTLFADGREDLIAESRRLLHDQVADATRSTVETATSRIVIATNSHIDFNRETAILAFTLGRAA